MNNNNHIEFNPKTEYKIGAVTYKVTAFFNDEKETLDTKVKRLILQESQKKEICTFVSQ